MVVDVSGMVLSHPQNIKDWEVMDDLQVDVTSGDNPQDLTIPGICEGYLLKRRKWPLKGWHKVSKLSIHHYFGNEFILALIHVFILLSEVLCVGNGDLTIFQNPTRCKCTFTILCILVK